MAAITQDQILDAIANMTVLEASELVKAKYFEKLGVDEAFLQKLKENAATKEDVISLLSLINF